MGWRGALLLAGSGLLAAGLVATGPPAAASAPIPAPTVPPDVAAYLAGPALVPQAIEATRHGRAGGPSPSVRATVGPAYQVYVFTDGFLAGDVDAAPVEPTDEWLAPLVDAGSADFMVSVTRHRGGPVELGYVCPCADDVAALTTTALRTTPGGALVRDTSNGALYLLERRTLTPLNHPDFPDVDGPITVARAQHVIAPRVAALRAAVAEQNRRARLWTWIPIGAAALVALASVAVAVAFRPRRLAGTASAG